MEIDGPISLKNPVNRFTTYKAAMHGDRGAHTSVAGLESSRTTQWPTVEELARSIQCMLAWTMDSWSKTVLLTA
jgi:hypothetical protein